MKRTPFTRKPGKEYKTLKRTPFKVKPGSTQLRGSGKPLRALGVQGKKWQKDRKEHSHPEAIEAGITYCALQYKGCWKVAQGHCHSLKRMNRTRPEHAWETIPGCNWCHTIAPWALEKKGKEDMAKEVRRLREQHGLPIWP